MTRRRSRAHAGFTLMEILIAMTILMIGLLPMLAVFKTALNQLNRAIEDTYAASVAQSVIDSIRLGLKDMKVEYPDGTKFFVLDHDGIEHLDIDRKGFMSDLNFDMTAPSHRSRLMERDYCILLPKATDVESLSGSTPRGKAFLFPRKSAGDNASRKFIEMVDQRVKGGDGKDIVGKKPKVEKVFHLGKALKDSKTEVEAADTYPQYSFAFTIRAAKAPDPKDPKTDLRQQNVLPGLYEVVVMVYRNFSDNKDSKRNDPVGGPGREFITYLSE